MCHVDNLKSILDKGILSHNETMRLNLAPKMISDKGIVETRKGIEVEGLSLWDYANVYFRVKNAMHYRVMKRIGAENVIIICLKKDILEIEGARISNGNAASSETLFFGKEGLKTVLREINPILKMEWWSAGDESKRKMMAECLIPRAIPTNYITKIIVLNRALWEKINSQFSAKFNRYNINLIAQLDFFNFPTEKIEITNNITLIAGDMFFSDNQTLTVSVNLTGVMGKGLASTVKYLVPDVYVKYQDVLKRGDLLMGKPFIYKRDKSIQEVLSEEEYLNDEEPTWFLIFPTKNHWRHQSDINGIEEGLKYLLEKYKEWGIKSLALPALGCGLGWLAWEDVGPIMVKYLKDMEIPVEIYLPQERRISDEYKKRDFLLNERKKSVS